MTDDLEREGLAPRPFCFWFSPQYPGLAAGELSIPAASA